MGRDPGASDPVTPRSDLVQELSGRNLSEKDEIRGILPRISGSKSAAITFLKKLPGHFSPTGYLARRVARISSETGCSGSVAGSRAKVQESMNQSRRSLKRLCR